MELRLMRYFVAVAEHLHFGRAADALATAQPSLSRQILQLENELGVKLFERTNRHVELTDAGRVFLEDAQRTLRAADVSVRHARENADGTRGELRLGFIGGAMLMTLPPVLREFRRRYPNVEVIPHAMHYPAHNTALLAGSIDIAWTIEQPHPEITSQNVARDGLMAALPLTHELAGQERVDITDLADDNLVVLTPSISPILYDEILRLCLSNGFRPRHIYEVLEEVTVIGLVAAEFGISITPYPWSVINTPGVVFRRLTDSYKIPEVLSWNKDRNTPIMRAFVETALEVLAVLEDVPS